MKQLSKCVNHLRNDGICDMPLQLFLVDVEQGVVKVQFMFPHGPCKTFNWRETENSCYVLVKNILCQIFSPTTATGRTCNITNEEYDKTIYDKSIKYGKIVFHNQILNHSIELKRLKNL